MPLDDEFRATLTSMLSRSLSSEHVRSNLIYMITEMVGSTKVEDAIKKAVEFKDITLLRILSMIIYNSDPLAFRDNAKVNDCEYVEDGSVIEVKLLTDEGELRIAYTTTPPYMVTSCRYAAAGEKKVEKDIVIKIA